MTIKHKLEQGIKWQGFLQPAPLQIKFRDDNKQEYQYNYHIKGKRKSELTKHMNEIKTGNHVNRDSSNKH